MERDRAKHNILPLSKFGLMQITRQRVRPVMDVPVDETCPTCFGKGTIRPSILFTDQLENKISCIKNKMKISHFTLFVHPYVYAYLTQRIISIKLRWQFRYGFGINLLPDQNLPFLSYRFIDLKGNEIDMKEEHEIL
jgi:ribonuclease G